MKRMQTIELTPQGDCAIVIKLGDQVDLETHRKVSILSRYLDEHPFEGMLEVIPAYYSVTVVYDPLQVFLSERKKSSTAQYLSPYEVVHHQVEAIVENLDDAAIPNPRHVEIPVCYGGEFGEDLTYVAEMNGLTPDEVIAIHTSGSYLVYMLGFAPGFPYLGGMDPRIAAPRKDTPRLRIPRGSVGIAGEQTGVYPLETPGGWQLIGRTPISLFEPDNQPPALLSSGDRISFYPISRREFDHWGNIT